MPAQFMKKLQHHLIRSYEKMIQYCQRSLQGIQKKLQIYNPSILKLSNQYKTQLDLVDHYRRKIQSIRKKQLQTKQQIQKLDRNIQKKCLVEDQYNKVFRILSENYDIFRIQSEEYIKKVPFEIVIKLIQNSLYTTDNILSLVEDEKQIFFSDAKCLSKISSIISEISEFDDRISIHSQSLDQIDCQNVQSQKDMQKKQQQLLQRESLKQSDAMRKSTTRKNIRVSHLKRSLDNKSVQRKGSFNFHHQYNPHSHRFKYDMIMENINKIIEAQKSNIVQQSLHSKQLVQDLQKVFQNIPQPVTQKQLIKKIYQETKNKYSSNLRAQNLNQWKQKHSLSSCSFKSEFNEDSSSSHEKTFIERQQFKKGIKSFETTHILAGKRKTNEKVSHPYEDADDYLGQIMHKNAAVQKQKIKHTKELKHLNLTPHNQYIEVKSANQLLPHSYLYNHLNNDSKRQVKFEIQKEPPLQQNVSKHLQLKQHASLHSQKKQTSLNSPLNRKLKYFKSSQFNRNFISQVPFQNILKPQLPIIKTNSDLIAHNVTLKSEHLFIPFHKSGALSLGTIQINDKSPSNKSSQNLTKQNYESLRVKKQQKAKDPIKQEKKRKAIQLLFAHPSNRKKQQNISFYQLGDTKLQQKKVSSNSPILATHNNPSLKQKQQLILPQNTQDKFKKQKVQISHCQSANYLTYRTQNKKRIHQNSDAKSNHNLKHMTSTANKNSNINFQMSSNNSVNNTKKLDFSIFQKIV